MPWSFRSSQRWRGEQVDELLRRQESLTQLLRTMIPQGVALGQRLRLWLTERGVSTPTAIGAQLPEATEADHDGAATLRRYRELLRALEDLMQLMQRTISGTRDPGANRHATMAAISVRKNPPIHTAARTLRCAEG